jgi:predicted Zn-dependent protease
VRRILPIAAVAAFVICTPLLFSFGLDLGKIVSSVQDVGKMAKGAAGIGLDEERSIGGSVALEIISRYGGIDRDEAATRRLNLLGKSLAGYSSRPGLQWRFGLLHSDTINAFSAPGGYVFITRGLYDQLKSDDALAGVLSHEITHIARRHALKIIARNEFLSGASDLASQQSAQLRKFDIGIGQITTTLLEKGFDPQTEYEADSGGRALALTTGYAPGALRMVLIHLQQRGGDPHRIFSTHPPLVERIKRLPDDPPAPAVPSPVASIR